MRFKVVGPHAVDGVGTGGNVKIDDPDRARYLIRAGHLAKPAPKKEEVSDGDLRTD
jgi:hypothetical protein